MKDVALEYGRLDPDTVIWITLRYTTSEMHSLTISFCTLAMMQKDQELNMRDALMESGSVSVDSIAVGLLAFHACGGQAFAGSCDQVD